MRSINLQTTKCVVVSHRSLPRDRLTPGSIKSCLIHSATPQGGWHRIVARRFARGRGGSDNEANSPPLQFSLLLSAVFWTVETPCFWDRSQSRKVCQWAWADLQHEHTEALCCSRDWLGHPWTSVRKTTRTESTADSGLDNVRDIVRSLCCVAATNIFPPTRGEISSARSSSISNYCSTVVQLYTVQYSTYYTVHTVQYSTSYRTMYCTVYTFPPLVTISLKPP